KLNLHAGKRLIAARVHNAAPKFAGLLLRCERQEGEQNSQNRAGHAFLPKAASRLQGPAPAADIHRNRKQYRTVTSPPFRSGKNPIGKWTRKYATAISPQRTNATHRVNRPSMSSGPPIVSITPAIPNIELISAGCPPRPPSHPKVF